MADAPNLDELLTENERLRRRVAELEARGACPLSEVCRRINAMEGFLTFREAASALEDLALLLSRQRVSPESTLAAWIKLSGYLRDLPSHHLVSPGNVQDVCTKGFECLVALVRWLKDSSDSFASAVAELRFILRVPELRCEAIRILLVELLRWGPEESALLALYRVQLEWTAEALNGQAEIPFEFALGNIGNLTEVDSKYIGEFLVSAFPPTSAAWRRFGNKYREQLHRLFSDRTEPDQALGENKLQDILRKAQGYIDTHEPGLFEQTRDLEYLQVVRVIHAIHRQQGNSRVLRLPNRHVVTDEPAIAAIIKFPDSSVSGSVRNFAVGDHRFQGGAWVVSTGPLAWPADPKVWLPADLVLNHPDLRQPLTVSVTVSCPELYHGQYGFRVTWGPSSVALTASLQPLRQRYPLKR
jgi:hypothetical protein